MNEIDVCYIIKSCNSQIVSKYTHTIFSMMQTRKPENLYIKINIQHYMNKVSKVEYIYVTRADCWKWNYMYEHVRATNLP